MSPMTLTLLMCLMTISGATTTDYSYDTTFDIIPSPFIIINTPTTYTTIDGKEGILMITDYIYTNTTSNFNNIKSVKTIEDMLYDITYQFCELILWIFTYKYIINNIFFIYTTYNRVKNYLNNIIKDDELLVDNPIKESIKEESFILPNILIEETIINDEEDDYQNCIVYKTSKYEMYLWNSNNVKIDDIVCNGDCYVETNDGYLYCNNYKQIIFKNLTYRELLILATSSPFTEKNKIIEIDDIELKNNKDNIQILTLKYN